MDTASPVEVTCARAKCERTFIPKKPPMPGVPVYCSRSCSNNAYNTRMADVKFEAPDCPTCKHHEVMAGGTVVCRQFAGLVCKPGLLGLKHEPITAGAR